MPCAKIILSALAFTTTAFSTSTHADPRGHGGPDLHWADPAVDATIVHKVAVFPHDGRKELVDTSAPWRAIGRLSIPDGTTCTASLVGPDLVLTNAHCVADTEQRRILPGKFVFKAQYRRGRAIAESGVKEIITGGFKISHDNREGDWALLVLRKRLGDELGWLGISDYETADLLTITDHYKLYMAGYANDKFKSEVPVWQGNCAFHQPYLNRQNVLTHDCSTTNGASGSPMFVFVKNKEGKAQPVIVAIHSGNRFASDKRVSEHGRMVPFDENSANLAVHSSQFIGVARKYRERRGE